MDFGVIPRRGLISVAEGVAFPGAGHMDLFFPMVWPIPTTMEWHTPTRGGVVTPGMPPLTPPMSPDQEVNFLKNQADILRQQLDQIAARVKDLENIGRDSVAQENVS